MINGMHVFVGASTARPPIWRCSAFTKKLIVNQTATGEQCSPLQALQLTTSDDTYEYYDNYEVYEVYDLYDVYDSDAYCAHTILANLGTVHKIDADF